MGIISTITLKDDYTSNAKRIEKSIFSLESASKKMEKGMQTAGKSFQKVFGQKYDLKIKDVKSKAIRKDLQKMQSELRKTTGKEYQVKITTTMNRKGLQGIKEIASDGAKGFSKTFGNLKNKALDIKMNTTSLLKAKLEARNLSKELTKTTGKKHKVDIELNDGTKGFFGGLKDKFSGMFGKKERAPDIGGGGGGSIGKAMMKAVVGGNLITGAISKGVGVAKTAVGSVIGGGFERLSNIQGSKATLKGLGYNKKDTNSIMGSALASVKGTPFGMGEAAMTASGAVAAGVKPGKELTAMLKSVSNSAAAAGVGMGEMGGIFNKVVTSDVAQNEELQQVADRGLPIYQKLGEVMGVSANEVKKLASQGKIDYATFEKGMTLAGGSVAAEKGNTVQGSFDNFKASLSRIGANLLGGADGEGGIFAQMVPAIQSVTEKLGIFEEKAGGIGEKIGTFASGLMESIGPAFQGFMNVVRPLGEALIGVIQPLIPHFMTLASIIGPVLSTAFQSIGNIITGSVVPMLQVFGQFVSTASNALMSVLVPVFNRIASIMTGTVIPAFSALVSGGINIAKTAFSALKGVINGVTGAFKAVKGAVNSAVGALKGIGSRISGAIGGLFGGGGGGHATGTSYFEGGWTRINERGEELIQLARGAKIYPSGKTSQMIQRDLRKTSTHRSDSKVIHYAPVITVNGANMTNKEVGDLIERRLRRLAVNV